MRASYLSLLYGLCVARSRVAPLAESKVLDICLSCCEIYCDQFILAHERKHKRNSREAAVFHSEKFSDLVPVNLVELSACWAVRR